MHSINCIYAVRINYIENIKGINTVCFVIIKKNMKKIRLHKYNRFKKVKSKLQWIIGTYAARIT